MAPRSGLCRLVPSNQRAPIVALAPAARLSWPERSRWPHGPDSTLVHPIWRAAARAALGAEDRGRMSPTIQLRRGQRPREIPPPLVAAPRAAVDECRRHAHPPVTRL